MYLNESIRTMNFEEALTKINKFVTIDKDDRPVYTKDFDNVRYKIFGEMKTIDAAFNLIASSPCLGGSYADNLKVSKPDEFDLVLQLDFPDQSLIEIENVEHLPGFVTLKLTTLLRKIKNEIQTRPLYTKLLQLVDDDDYLVQSKFQRWVQSIVDTVLNRYPGGMMVIDDKEYYISKRSIEGPAQTLKIEVESRSFSIDFVPALRFPISVWPAKRPCPWEGRNKPWIAVPKPLKNTTIAYDPDNLYWITSFVDQERYFIEGKYFLKPSIRLLKKLRDRYSLTNLKSYFIKTVFLWIVVEKQEEGDYDFGRRGLGVTFLYGFEKLLEYFDDGHLPFFWNESFNMLIKLTEQQRSDIYNKLKAIRSEILKCKDTNPEKLFEIFLEKWEKEQLQPSRIVAVRCSCRDSRVFFQPSREPKIVTESYTAHNWKPVVNIQEKEEDQWSCTII